MYQILPVFLRLHTNILCALSAEMPQGIPEPSYHYLPLLSEMPPRKVRHSSDGLSAYSHHGRVKLLRRHSYEFESKPFSDATGILPISSVLRVVRCFRGFVSRYAIAHSNRLMLLVCLTKSFLFI